MKKLTVLALSLLFALSFAACGTAEKVVSDTESAGESIISDAESDMQDAESDIKDDEDSTDLMASITSDQAKTAALEHAGLDESQVSDVEIDLDRDNGTLVYEVNFTSGNTEYDYHIDANTGEIILSNKAAD